LINRTPGRAPGCPPAAYHSGRHSEAKACLTYTLMAAVKRMVTQHDELCIRTSHVSKGLYWESHARGALLASDVEINLEATLRNRHAKFNPADLDGLMVGESFLKRVIRAPKVQAPAHVVV